MNSVAREHASSKNINSTDCEDLFLYCNISKCNTFTALGSTDPSEGIIMPLVENSNFFISSTPTYFHLLSVLSCYFIEI